MIPRKNTQHNGSHYTIFFSYHTILFIIFLLFSQEVKYLYRSHLTNITHSLRKIGRGCSWYGLVQELARLGFPSDLIRKILGGFGWYHSAKELAHLGFPSDLLASLEKECHRHQVLGNLQVIIFKGSAFYRYIKGI